MKRVSANKDIFELLQYAVDNELESFEESIVPAVEKHVSEYDRDWCAEDIQDKYETAREQYIESLINDILLKYYRG